MLSYLSSSPGIGGEIKKTPEDFLVEEIMQDGTVLEAGKSFSRQSSDGDFTHFVMEKKNWNTIQAVGALSKKCGCGKKRFSYAGNKDRRALTTQLCSAWRVPPEQLLSLKVKDIEVNGAWVSEKKVSLGGLLGNRFTLRVKGVSEDATEKVARIERELEGVFPNYFGSQRFGSVRANTHLVGEHIVRGSFEDAVWEYLCFIEPSEMQEAREARERLLDEKDFSAALEYFPKHLKYERTLLGHLSARPRDFVGAMRKLPRGLALLFVHSYQSSLFNKLLDKRVKERDFSVEEGGFYCPANEFGFPEPAKTKRASLQEAGMVNELVSVGKAFPCARIVGWETKDLTDSEKQSLEEEGIAQADFRVKPFPEIGSKGSARSLTCPLKDFSFDCEGDDGLFRFSLPSGSYATVALREFLDKKD